MLESAAAIFPRERPGLSDFAALRVGARRLRDRGRGGAYGEILPARLAEFQVKVSFRIHYWESCVAFGVMHFDGN